MCYCISKWNLTYSHDFQSQDRSAHTHVHIGTHSLITVFFVLISDVSMDQGIDVANTMKITASLIALK